MSFKILAVKFSSPSLSTPGAGFGCLFGVEDGNLFLCAGCGPFQGLIKRRRRARVVVSSCRCLQQHQRPPQCPAQTLSVPCPFCWVGVSSFCMTISLPTGRASLCSGTLDRRRGSPPKELELVRVKLAACGRMSKDELPISVDASLPALLSSLSLQVGLLLSNTE